MNNKNKELIKTLQVQTTSYNDANMIKFIKEEVSKIKGCKLFNDKGNLYITKGKAKTYPSIVAHMDTVHDLVPNFNIFELNGYLFSIDGSTMERVGIGGDDKVGVYIALEVLRKFDICKIAFFRDEEMGCLGSSEAKMSFFDNSEFILQCDRQGYGDFVNEIYGVPLYTEEFSETINSVLKKYGRKEVSGGMTDVYQLAKNGLPLCTANMSCGYYDPHSDNEFVDIEEVENTKEMVFELFNILKGNVWGKEVYKYVPYTYYPKNKDSELDNYIFGGGENEYYDDSPFFKHDVECPMCHSISMEKDIWNDLSYCFNCEEYIDIKHKEYCIYD